MTQDQAGQKAPRPGCRGKKPQETPASEKPLLYPEQRGMRGRFVTIKNNSTQERPEAGPSQRRSVEEQEPSDQTGRPDLPQGNSGEETCQGYSRQEKEPPRDRAL